MTRPLYFGRGGNRNTPFVEQLRDTLEADVRAAGRQRIAPHTYGYAVNASEWEMRSVVFGDDTIFLPGGRRLDDPPVVYMEADYRRVQQHWVYPALVNRTERRLMARILAAPLSGTMTLEVKANRVFTTFDSAAMEEVTGVDEGLSYTGRIETSEQLTTIVEHMGAVMLNPTLSQYEAWQHMVPEMLERNAKALLDVQGVS